MSNNVLAQSATQLTVSNNGEWTYDMCLQVARKCAEVNVKGTVRERKMLDYNKLSSQVCARYRDHFCAIYAKTDTTPGQKRVPADVYEMISKACEQVILENLTHVHAQNIVSMSRKVVHVSKDLKHIERVTMIGENTLTLKEQHLFNTIDLKTANDKLTKLQQKPTPDYDREQLIRKQIEKLTDTRLHIEKVMAEPQK